MVSMADFDTVFQTPALGPPPMRVKPDGTPLFIGSYAPVTPAGQQGPFWTNTYFLQDDRKSELLGSVANRQFQVCGPSQVYRSY
jgi:hypothetical protein